MRSVTPEPRPIPVVQDIKITRKERIKQMQLSISKIIAKLEK